MENQLQNNISNVSWVLVGVRPVDTEVELTEEMLGIAMQEAFKENNRYKLFLCGADVNKEGTLEELEIGYHMVKQDVEEFADGDYCIIYNHPLVDLLFMAVPEDMIPEIESLANGENKEIQEKEEE